MIAFQPGQRALHALRLVLRDSYAPSLTSYRQFSVAVLHNYPQQASSSSSSKAREWGPRHASSDYEGTSDFLEDPLKPEYSSASLALPDRGHTDTAHWANLFPSPSTTTSVAVKQRRCDTLARLVSLGDLVTARKVYDELSALHIGILRRSLYLDAALASLDQTPAGRAAFLFWLELVPNRPAVRPHPGIKAIWAPVINRLLNDHSSNLDFIGDFLTLMARKGILPSVIGPFMRHLALFTSPEDLGKRMEKLEKVYLGSTTSMHSTSTRARAHEVFAKRRVEGMWNSFIRALAAAGWKTEVDGMMRVLEGRMEITDYTRQYVLERQELYGDTKSDQSLDDPPTPTLSPPEESLSIDPTVPRIVRRIRRARQGLVRPSEMSDLILLLSQHHRHNFIRLLGNKMERSSEKTREMWYHSQLLFARRDGKGDREVLGLFQRWFHWVGLPDFSIGRAGAGDKTQEPDSKILQEQDHSLSLQSSSLTSRSSKYALVTRSKLYPSPALLTTLLPSLLSLLGSPSQVLSFHTSYLDLAPSLSPRVRPTPVTHSVLLREITHLFGPSTGLLALRNMISSGLEPDLGAYNAILWSLAGRGEFGDVRRLLGAMESGTGGIGSGKGENEVIMPRPDEKTYKGIAGILDRIGMNEEASEMRNRLRTKGYAEKNFRGSRERINREERRMGFVYGKKKREMGRGHRALGEGSREDWGEEEWEKEKVAAYG